MYGYEIVKIVNARTNGRFEWKEGTLYPTLHRLEADGLIRSQWQDKSQSTEPSGGAQRRKYYATTRRGRAELTRRRTEWRQFSESMDAVLMGA